MLKPLTGLDGFVYSPATTLNLLCALLLCSTGVPALAQEESATARRTSDEQTGKPADEETSASDDESTAPEELTELLSDDFPKGWKHACSKEGCKLEDIWHRAPSEDNGATLICSGEPKGLIYTELQIDNFELTLEWRYPADEKGNSGILVYIQPSEHLWPDSMQIQLHQPEAGSVFPSGKAESANRSEARDLAKPVGEWNSCRIVSTDGTLTVEINGKPAGKVSGCQPRKGAIGFQSEGSEIHFRKLRLRPLPSTDPASSASPAAAATEDKPEESRPNAPSSPPPKAG